MTSVKRRRGGAHSRRKGAGVEREIVHRLQDAGFAAEKISRMHVAGPDLNLPLLGKDHKVEVKIEANGFNKLYKWLAGIKQKPSRKTPPQPVDLLIVRADRKEALVIMPMHIAVELFKSAERGRIKPPITNEPLITVYEDVYISDV